MGTVENNILISLERTLRNPAEIYKFVAQELYEIVMEHFMKETEGEGGSPWLVTKNSKSGHILKKSGALIRSIRSHYSDSYAVVGTNLKYAGTHQFGATIQRAARSETFKRKKNASGKFAKMNKKDYAIGRGFTFTSHVTKIPARPFIAPTSVELQKLADATARKIISLSTL